MQIVNVQQCYSVVDGPTSVMVPSHSNSLKQYECIVTDSSNVSEVVCECKGYNFNGHCSHQPEAVEMLCEWRQILGPEAQTESQRDNMICPRCGDDTKWIMEALDDRA